MCLGVSFGLIDVVGYTCEMFRMQRRRNRTFSVFRLNRHCCLFLPFSILDLSHMVVYIH